MLWDNLIVYRRKGIGSYRDFAQAMAVTRRCSSTSTTPATSRRPPNENFGRELMELFTPRPNGTYTEADVRGMAGRGRATTTTTTATLPVPRRPSTTTATRRSSASPATGTVPRRSPRSSGARRQSICARSLRLAARCGRSSPTRTPPPRRRSRSSPRVRRLDGMNVKALVRAVFLRPEFRLPATRTAWCAARSSGWSPTMQALGMNAAALHPEWWRRALRSACCSCRRTSAAGSRTRAWIATSALGDGRPSLDRALGIVATDAGVLAGPASNARTLAVIRFKVLQTFGIEAVLDRPPAVEAYVGRRAKRRQSLLGDPAEPRRPRMLTPDFQLA